MVSRPNSDRDETIALTRAMVEVGDRLAFDNGPILDKQCLPPSDRHTWQSVRMNTTA